MAGKVIVGVGTYGPLDTCWNSSDLYIGNYTSIGRELRVYLGGNHNPKFVSQYPFYNSEEFSVGREWETKGDVVIGSDVWIGEYVTIMSGVHIGDGATIAAKSVVAKNVPPFALAAGNPASVRKFRFSEGQIERLLRVSWWNWTEERVKGSAHLLCAPLTEETLVELERRAK